MNWRWTLLSSFFDWWQDPNSIDKFKKVIDENVRSLMELMHQEWSSIMFMPYKFFMDTLKWKIDLENAKMDNTPGKTGGSSSKGLVKG